MKTGVKIVTVNARNTKKSVGFSRKKKSLSRKTKGTLWIPLIVTWDNLAPSMAECEQVRVVDVTDDWKYLCTLPAEIMTHVDNALKNAFFYEEGGGVNDGE